MKFDLAATIAGLILFAGVTLAAPQALAASFPALEIQAATAVERAQQVLPPRDEDEDVGVGDDEDDDEAGRDVPPLPPRPSVRDRYDDEPRREAGCEWVRRQVQTSYGSEWRLTRVCGQTPERRPY